jgi:hypothetical protein
MNDRCARCGRVLGVDEASMALGENEICQGCYRPTPPTAKTWEIGDGNGREITVIARHFAVAELAQRIYDRCDECLQASDMLEFFPDQPELHTTTSLHRAMLAAGCEIETDGGTK